MERSRGQTPVRDCPHAPFNDAGWQALVLHDLRAPLTIVSFQAQILRRLATTEPSADVARMNLAVRAERIERAVAQMAGMLDELQSRGCEQRGTPPPLERDRMDLVEVARRVASDSSEQARDHRLNVVAADEHVIGYWDAARLERAIGNLVGNAVKYSPPDSEVVLEVWREWRPGGEWAAIAVRDSGVGIPEGDLPHIFDRFFRAANAVGRFQGSGLGLAGVRQVVEQHGGNVTVETIEGRGTTFTVLLPLGSGC